MAEIKKNRQQRVPGARKIRNKELPVYTRQIAAMLSSGMPLVQCLIAMADQTENKNFKVVVAGVRGKVEAGTSYSDALRSYPTVFDDLYVNMMRAGETGGILAETCERVASFLESSNKLRRKVKSAMMYPSVVIVVALLMASGLVVFIVPVFADMFADFGANLPAPTQALMDLSDFMRRNLLIIIVVVAALVYGFNRFVKSERGSYIWDNFKLHFPILGKLAQQIAVSRFASTFASLLHSGVPILQALDIVGVATGNKVIGKTILKARENVERGEPLSAPLRDDKNFPRMLIHMLSAGEQTGKIDEMLDKTAEFYEDEVEAMVSGLTSMIEPLLMVFIGVIIGSIVVCMFLPIFKMGEVVSM